MAVVVAGCRLTLMSRDNGAVWLLRPEAAGRLHSAAEMLPSGFSLKLLDAWRSLEEQRAIRDRLAASAARETNVRRFVYDPDAANQTAPGYPTDAPPHCTGGAVDVALVGPDGEDWPMGTSYDEMSDLSATSALELLAEARPLSVVEEQARVGRQILLRAMSAAGFSNYPAEWWHFDFGNSFWRYFGGHGPGPVYGIVDLTGDEFK